jgi:hypothetical protein
MAEGGKQTSQRRRGNQTAKGLRNRIRGTFRWAIPVHLRCLTKKSEKITCVGLHKAVLLSTTWAVQ